MSAAFILQGWHLRNETAIDELADYNLIVCNPSLDPDEVRDCTDATLLAYYHAHTIPAYGEGNTFYDSMRAQMDQHSTFILHAGADAHELHLSFDAYEDYAAWITENLSGWDGVYLDEAWDIPDQRWVVRCGRDYMDTRVRWAALLEYFRFRLAAQTIVANIGPPDLASNSPNHRLWDAISLEEPHLARHDLPTLAALYSSMRSPAFNVAWWSNLSFPGLVMPGIRLPEEQP